MRLSAVAIAATVAALYLIGGTGKAEADHGLTRCGGNGLLACLLQSSPFVNRVVKPAKELLWCVDARGYQYPQFRNQTEEVMQAWAEELRLPGQREVAYGAGCDVKHSMIDNHPCGGCGAWVYVSNDPVLIEYNAKAGYSLWFSTGGHEFGHTACLLDEHYDKVAFTSYILKHGVWIHGQPTVMDSGTPFLAGYAPRGIWRPTEYDLDRCAETLKRAVGVQEPPTSFPFWDAAAERWRYEDGRSYHPNSGCGEYFNAANQRTMAQCDDAWGGRFVVVGNDGVWLHRGTPVFTFGEWWTVP